MNKPWVTINCAMSVDGKIALPSRKQTKISNKEDIQRIHQVRNTSDAILVGIGTIVTDDPKLLVKKDYVTSPSKPLRIVLDSNYRIPKNAQVLTADAPTMIVTTCIEKRYKNVEVVKCGTPGNRVDLKQLLEFLYSRGIKRIMVEGGETVIWEFLKNNLVDELLVFIGPLVIGGVSSPTLAGGEGASSLNSAIHLTVQDVKKIGDGLLITCTPKKQEG